jgi:hypothetical protein
MRGISQEMLWFDKQAQKRYIAQMLTNLAIHRTVEGVDVLQLKMSKAGLAANELRGALI